MGDSGRFARCCEQGNIAREDPESPENPSTVTKHHGACMNTVTKYAAMLLLSLSSCVALNAQAQIVNPQYKPDGSGALSRTFAAHLDDYTGAGRGVYNASNTVSGIGALGATNGTIGYNTAIGWNSQLNSVIGGNNTSVGARSMLQNVNGVNSVAIGDNAYRNMGAGGTSPAYNTAVGMGAMYVKSSGSNNTAVGADAFGSFKDPADRAIGDINGVFHDWQGRINTGGSDNTAIGQNALTYTSGDGNTGVGMGVGVLLTTGTYNTLLGYRSGDYDHPNALLYGHYNTFVGANTGTVVATNGGSYMTAIGAGAVVSSAQTVVLGRIGDVTAIGKTGIATNSDYSGSNLQLGRGMTFGNTDQSGKRVLDWYEERDFTVTAANIRGTNVYVGKATRIGRLVHFVITISTSTTSAGTAPLAKLTGLPWKPVVASTCLSSNASTGLGYGTGFIGTDGSVLPATWAATGGQVNVTGSYVAVP